MSSPIQKPKAFFLEENEMVFPEVYCLWIPRPASQSPGDARGVAAAPDLQRVLDDNWGK
jgi:hypothetical protein